MSSFITGGSATALFTGKYNGYEASDSIERSMGTDISASYGFKMKSNADGKVSADFGIGKSFANGTSTSNKIESLATSVKTVGGSTEFSSFSIPLAINDVDIDFSQWVKSLNDKSTHRVIDIADGGLIPLVNFVIEKNLKNELLKLYQTGTSLIKEFQEPYLAVCYLDYNGQMMIIRSVLVTRFGDILVLRDELVHVTKILEEFENEKIRLSKIYGLKMVSKYIQDDGNLSFRWIDETKMKKFVDKNNVIYLLYSDNDLKYAYSIHGDYLLDTYAIRKFVDNLPSVQIDPIDLFSYTIVAL